MSGIRTLTAKMIRTAGQIKFLCSRYLERAPYQHQEIEQRENATFIVNGFSNDTFFQHL